MLQNSRLKAKFSLNHKVAVYVPATININETIDNTKQVEEAATLLSNLFGGATSSPVNGYWVSDTAGLVKEKTVMVFAFADETSLKNGIDEVIDFAEKIKLEMNQDAVALEIDNEMFFI